MTPGCGDKAQKPRKPAIVQVPVISSHRDPGQAHMGANDFAKQVGNLLKERYPSKVEGLKVTLTINILGGEELYHLSYFCYVVPTTPDQAQYYFDRRGTILSGKTDEDAKNKVNAQINNTNKIGKLKESFQKTYGNYYMPDEFVLDSASKSQDGKSWYVKEYFITAQKKADQPASQ
jgi:hypothetical protein